MSCPSKVCYVAPLNIVKKRDRLLREPLAIQTASFDNLLRRCDFDWAEDAEEAAAHCNASIASTTLDDFLPQADLNNQCTTPHHLTSFDYKPTVAAVDEEDFNACTRRNTLNHSLPKVKANRYNEMYPALNYTGRFKYTPSLPTIYEEVWDEIMGWVDGTPETASSPSESISTESYDHTTGPWRNETPFTDNDDLDGNLAALQAIGNIFADRQAWIDVDEAIHHYNWMGRRVYTRSSTSPSDSLAMILATPKNPQGSDLWRIQSVINRALPYIDPVVVFLNDTGDRLLELRGSELVRASTGRVFKFYTPHGRWMEDSGDKKDETTTDFGSTQTYDATDLAVGNGFVESSPICSLSQWTECRDRAFDSSEQLNRLPRKLTWKHTPSPLRQCESISPPETFEAPCTTPPLRQCESISPLETSEALCPQGVSKAKRPAWKITTCVAGAPSEEYFSFPTPTFGRPKGIKPAFAKAQKGLKSLFNSVKSTIS
ncbi:uncharacterized protein N7479_010721 [Penicillium vulpinum]|uniref:Uncharacterized protein n=1 Tax=Penicillium vulpinum TaxID=29845 RepID=A0A1V6S9N1_9EURO|nr:uncharacterized protein N7479_010721 [Penicillium vulpinum]KAJ5952308.1 hypothetical protein N7479_010721 [Penicillium vulpinum]OQE10460.1 hypothetical protein PENVUL_c004G07391 [Penicillium vulpinum]